MKHLRTARPGWITLDQRVQMVPYGTLIPGLVDGSLDDLEHRLDVLLDGDQMGLDDRRAVVRYSIHVALGNLDVQGLGM